MTGNAAQIVSFLMTADREKLFDLREHRERRSLTQNSYYWKLLSLTADKLRMSKTELHNRMLREHGQKQYLGGKLVTVMIPDTEEAERSALKAETYHIQPTAQTIQGQGGTRYRQYLFLRGSSDYDTREMSVLLDGMINEAQQQGIETLTPAELEKIREYEREAEKRQVRKG
jgi:hypothetical protein